MRVGVSGGDTSGHVAVPVIGVDCSMECGVSLAVAPINASGVTGVFAKCVSSGVDGESDNVLLNSFGVSGTSLWVVSGMNRQICYYQLYLECGGSEILVRNLDSVFVNLLLVIFMSLDGYTCKNFLAFIQSIFSLMYCFWVLEMTRWCF